MDFKSGDLIGRNFRLDQLLLTDGFSQTWKATNLNAHNDVAIKISPHSRGESVDLLRQEYLRLSRLKHSNIARYFQFGEEDGYSFWVTSYFPNGPVEGKAGQLTEAELWRLIRDISSALDYLYGQSPPILHQNIIRSDNIFMDFDGGFVLSEISFNSELAKSLPSAYLAPELFRYPDQAPRRRPVILSDVWSLGACLYELATGKLPFGEQGGFGQLAQAEDGDKGPEYFLAPLPSRFSADFNKLVFNSLALLSWERPSIMQLLGTASARLSGPQTPRYTASDGKPLSFPNAPSTDEPSALPKINRSILLGDAMREAPKTVMGDDSKFDMRWPEMEDTSAPSLPPLLSAPLPPSPPPAPIQNLQTKGGGTDGNLVKCSVYASPAVKARTRTMVQVWLHEKKQQKIVAKMAQYFFPGSDVRQSKYLELPLKQGDIVWVELMCSQVAIPDNIQKIRWQGEAEAADFWVDIPADIQADMLAFTARLRMGDVPVGDFKFSIALAQEASKPDALRGIPRVFKKAFLSYASQDREEVLKRAQVLDSMNIQYFFDLLNLKPGELWERALYTEIDTSDVFYLFWSEHSKSSEWVAKEINHALHCKKGNEDAPPAIIPIPIGRPPIPEPPDNLRHLHFNDRLLYVMQSEASSRTTRIGPRS